MLVDRPVEECGMEAFTTCRPVTRLAPSLEPKQTCRDVPREKCSSSKVDKYIITIYYPICRLRGTTEMSKKRPNTSICSFNF